MQPLHLNPVPAAAPPDGEFSVVDTRESAWSGGKHSLWNDGERMYSRASFEGVQPLHLKPVPAALLPDGEFSVADVSDSDTERRKTFIVKKSLANAFASEAEWLYVDCPANEQRRSSKE